MNKKAALKLTWGAHFPKDCPPSDAAPRTAVVFVFVRADPPNQDDFKSHRERGLYTTGSGAIAFDDCKACGLSVSHTLEDAKRLQDALPHLRKKKIARGVPTVGVLRDTDGPVKEIRHLTWWIPGNSAPWTAFKVA